MLSTIENDMSAIADLQAKSWYVGKYSIILTAEFQIVKIKKYIYVFMLRKVWKRNYG